MEKPGTLKTSNKNELAHAGVILFLSRAKEAVITEGKQSSLFKDEINEC